MMSARGAQKTDVPLDGRPFDVVVVGGGPAGMLAAGTAAANGFKVVLVEKNKTLGKKLLLTGNGRCNLTQNEPDVRALVKRYGKNGPFLFSSFSAFGPGQVMEFFESLGVPLKTENLQRVFPKSDKAEDVRRALEKWLAKMGVKVVTGTSVIGLEVADDCVVGVETSRGTLKAKKVIVTTGGLSYPSTGSTGDAWAWVRVLGLEVTQPVPSLVPLKVQDKDVGGLKGLSLSDVEVAAAGAKARGDMIFTHFGLSGPAVFVVSGAVSRELSAGRQVEVSVDVLPDVGLDELDRRLLGMFRQASAKSLKNVLSEIVAPRLAECVCVRLKLQPSLKAGQFTADQRRRLARILKKIEFKAIDTLGWNTAMVTSGGLALNQIDPKTMECKKIKGLHFAGEVLDLDGPTGGYNLQVAWSTGRAAGSVR